MRHVGLDTRIGIRHHLPRIQARTLVIGCAQDITVPVENSRALHTAIADSTYAEIDAGHMAFFEREDEFVKLVHEFALAP
ncbi:alpha/beta fold hydrolase [Streptomyces sp. NPDC059991]|uniref:alpha/beta fold hydrolase n=1 Tax=unclassified Streptomyces TaxID=2593676 RepID=UPI0036C56CA2